MFLCVLSVCVCDIDYRGTFSGLGPGFSLSMNYRRLHSLKFQRICILASRTRLSGLKQSLVISSDRFTEKNHRQNTAQLRIPLATSFTCKLNSAPTYKLGFLKSYKTNQKDLKTRKLGSLRCTE